jgi:hypothetical protein
MTVGSQSKRHSLLETCVGTGIGFAIAMWSQIIIYPWFNIHVSHTTNFKLTTVFTVISIARGYAVRRGFNWWHARGLQQEMIEVP